MAKRKAANGAVTIPVEFGGISIGDHTARIGVTIRRGEMTLEYAEKTFVERRLAIEMLNQTDDATQQELPGFDGVIPHLEAVADSKKIGLSSAEIRAGLVFSRNDCDLQMLTRFAKRPGKLVILDVDDIPAPVPE